MTERQMRKAWEELARLGCNYKISYHIFRDIILYATKEKTLFEKYKPIKKSEVEKFSVLQQLENITEGKEK